MPQAMTMDAEASPPLEVRARIGRPPRVSTAQIVATALDIGLETVTFRQIAERLGVAQATLYRHVHNRDELVRLAAFELTLARRLPSVAQEHWSQLAARYAESLFQAFVAEPQLITELLKGRLGPHAELDVLEDFIGVIARHGFDAEAAAALFHAIGMLSIGAASGAIGLKASIAGGEPWSQRMRMTLDERDDDELPQVRAVFGKAPLQSLLVDWRRNLQFLLSGIAQARGEALPEYAGHPQPVRRSRT